MSRSAGTAGVRATPRVIARGVLVAMVLAHGILHLLGAAKGLDWADASPLQEPISTADGWAWLAAGALVLLVGFLLALRSRWWWAVGAVAVVASQSMLFTSWSDAKAGTGANAILLGAVVYGYSSLGPTSLRAQYHRQAESALGDLPLTRTAEAVVTEADLAALPGPVADYVRHSGAVGRPRTASFRARIHGRIRGGATKPWMDFAGEQVNTYGTHLARHFYLDATMFGLPVDVLHSYVGASATMRVKLASLVPIVDASGADLDRAETVTLFNDLCILAPAALVDACVVWQAVDDHHARGEFTNGPHTVSADLTFNDNHELVDFTSQDRLRASADGTTFIRQGWSTPVWDTRTFDARRVSCYGEAHWHAPDPEGEFSYLEFTVDDLTYNVHPAPTAQSGSEVQRGRRTSSPPGESLTCPPGRSRQRTAEPSQGRPPST